MKKLTETERKTLIDELGQLDADIAPLDDKKNQADALREQVRALYEDKPAEKAYSAEGFKFTCTIDAKGNERSIKSMLLVFKALGQAKFIEAATVTLKKLEALLSPSELALLVDKARTGTRTVKTFAIAKGK